MRRAAISVAIRWAALGLSAVVAGCAGTGPKDQTAAADQSATAPPKLYEQLQYWPAYDQAGSNGEICLPESWISLQSLQNPAPQPTNLWEQVVAGYGFDSSVDEQRVQRQLNIYDGNQKLFDSVGQRASNYMHYVVEQLQERDMPMELALLPVVESAYNPTAVSHAQAAGMWQFIPGTGKRYGLEQNYWYDARKNVLASTDAALDYLQDLHEQFDGDWYLALAAYNAGEGRVEREIKRNKKLGKPTDYWSLNLPRETRNYVPRLIAVSRVLESPQDFGLTLEDIPLETSYAELEIDKPVNLNGALDQVGLDRDLFYVLNPAFRTSYTPPKTACRVLVPSDHVDSLAAALRTMPEANAYPPSKYRIKRGDTISTIARRHGVSAAELRAVNGLSSNMIRAGDTLVIPSNGPLPAELPGAIAQSSAAPVLYSVRPGDNLWTISRRAGTSTAALVALNGLDMSAPLQVGQKLRLHPVKNTATTATAKADTGGMRRIEYRVIRGDSIARISARFGVPTKDVLRWNGMTKRRTLIKPGQTIVLYLDPSHEALQVASAKQ